MLRRPWLSLALVAAAAASAQTKPPASDNLIVPGVRVGPVTRTSTEQSLRQALGKAAIKKDVDIGEGMYEPGLVLYNDDPTRRLAIVWNDDKPAHPATVFICYEEEDTTACRWHTASGIAFGTTLKDLERRNGRPFEMMVWGTDVGGNLVSFKGGQLDRELNFGALSFNLTPRINSEGEYLPKLTPEEFEAVQGEKFVSSSHPVLQKLNPYVAGMRMQFSRDIPSK